MTGEWALRRARAEVRRRPGALLALAAAFALIGLCGGATRVAWRTSPAFERMAEQDVHVIAYLGDEVEDVGRLTEALRRLPGVEKVSLVDSNQALQRLRSAAAAVGDAQGALAAIEPGFLPRSLEVGLAPGADLARRAAELGGKLKKLPGISGVDGMAEGVERLRTWMAIARAVAWGALGAGIAAMLAALAMAVARGRERRRAVGETLAFLGETPAGIRLPATIASAIAAVAGAAVGLALMLVLVPVIIGALRTALGVPVSVSGLGLVELGAGLLAAAVLGAVVGQLSTPVPRHA